MEVAGWAIRSDVNILRMHRDDAGALHLLIADMKSSTTAKVEHRLQIAFYHVMIATLLEQQGVAYSSINKSRDH
ncbi:MAG TPA: hypothetical protein VF914_12010 [Chloroflexia bacterium]